MPIETHPLQDTFRSGDTAKLRNKSGRCRKCDRERNDGEHFMLCSGCETALYCSKECQRADWSEHKPLCKFAQEGAKLLANMPPDALDTPIDAATPSHNELQALLRDFTEAHRPSFAGIFQAKMVSAGGTETFFSGEPKVCLVPLRYNPPPPLPLTAGRLHLRRGQNPAQSFTPTNIAFLPLARVLASRPELRAGWDASAVTRGRIRALHAAEGDADFVDVLPVVFAPLAGPAQMAYFPQYRRVNAASRTAAQKQLDMNMRFVELGIVVRPHAKREGAPEKPALGYMRPDGTKWTWRPFVDDWDEDREWHAARTEDERVALLKRRLEEVERSWA
ncbi:zf-MYND-domain-containing protein [Cubamyces sp. BRFM 1775]|nr:zf-MYND-domain-containing protein [Cubamyces sp. BRFM 1775]